MNKKRVLNVAKALRESEHPEDFTMSVYATKCGTPGCAFGHYAARRDLQRSFDFKKIDTGFVGVFLKGTEIAIDHGHESVSEHFDLTEAQVSRLFGCKGEAKGEVEDREIPDECFLSLSASTTEEAARWIESFAAEETQ